MSTTVDVEVTSHARRRWQTRAPDASLSPRQACLEAEPVDYPSLSPPAECARYHDETRMLLLGTADGAVLTAIPLAHRSRREQQHIRSQVTA